MKIRYWLPSSATVCYKNFISIILLFFFVLTACTQSGNLGMATKTDVPGGAELGVAVFAGGCFWCTESDFDKLPGVVSTISGYIGGTVESPTYEQVITGKTGHVEAVQVHFDTTKTDFATLLAAYWLTINPLTADRQFCDVGGQYRSVIFYHDAMQQKQSIESKAALQASNRFTDPVVTEILPATTFYPAEEYHQNYYLKNPVRYAYYRHNCGRDKILKELWGKKH